MPRVWVIEDNDLNFELVDYLLSEAGWETVRARDGGEFGALLAGALPDLVLLDMNLPDGSGLDLLGRLRASGRHAALPVIAVTAHAMQGDRQKFLDSGCDARRQADRSPRALRRDRRRAGARATMSEKLRILAVDDQPENLELLQAILEEEGYAVAFARDGVEALAAVGRQSAPAPADSHPGAVSFWEQERQRPASRQLPLWGRT